MKRFWTKYVEHNVPFHILVAVSVILLIASWCWPPTAIIDSSILAATGELIGWGALYTLMHAIDKGKTASVSHGQTTITIGDKQAEGEGEVEKVI